MKKLHWGQMPHNVPTIVLRPKIAPNTLMVYTQMIQPKPTQSIYIQHTLMNLILGIRITVTMRERRSPLQGILPKPVPLKEKNLVRKGRKQVEEDQMYLTKMESLHHLLLVNHQILVGNPDQNPPPNALRQTQQINDSIQL